MHAVVALKAKNRCGTRNLRMSVSLSLSLSLSLCMSPRVSAFSIFSRRGLFGAGSEDGRKNYRCYRIGGHDNGGRFPGKSGKSVFARPIRCAVAISRGRKHAR